MSLSLSFRPEPLRGRYFNPRSGTATFRHSERSRGIYLILSFPPFYSVYCVLGYEKRYTQLRRQQEAYARIENTDAARRERIPENVRLFVWQRDEGKCVKCGGTERIEFDHIVPVARGGSNTERNIQLLCETCNRAKGINI
jgi:hypothetical protein